MVQNYNQWLLKITHSYVHMHKCMDLLLLADPSVPKTATVKVFDVGLLRISETSIDPSLSLTRYPN